MRPRFTPCNGPTNQEESADITDLANRYVSVTPYQMNPSANRAIPSLTQWGWPALELGSLPEEVLTGLAAFVQNQYSLS